MDAQEALRTRRTVHAYKPDPLPEGALERALELACLAPNHRHTQPWRFTLVGPETRARLADLAVQIKARTRELPPAAEAKVRAKVETPAGLVVFRQVLADDPATREEDYAALACAAQNFMLSLHAEGLGSKWSSGKVTQDPEGYALLGVDPARERIVGFLWAGWAAAVPSPQKKPLAELLSRLP